MPEQNARPTDLGIQTLILTLGIAVVGSNSLVLSPILADVAKALDTGAVQVSRALAAYGGATALSAFLLAPQIDRLGARRMLRIGLTGLMLAMLGCAAAEHWLLLAGAQVLAGLGAGVVLPSIYALATAIAPPGRESRVLGRVLTGWSLSMVAGVPAAALLADGLGWRACFLVLAALAALTLPGAARLPRQSSPGPRASGPAALLAPLRYPRVPALFLVCLAYMASFYGVYAFVGDQVRLLHGLSASGAGLIVLAYGIGFGAASLGDGLVDRLGPRRVFPPTLAALAAIYAALPAVAGSLPLVLAVAGAWGFANHFGLNVLVLLLSRAKPEKRGAVLGLNSAVTYVGALGGVAAAGLLYGGPGFAAVGLGAALLMGAAALLALLRLSGEPARNSAAYRR